MSNTHREFESRIMLTDEEYLSIVSYYLKIYPNHKFLQISNVYFDSEDLFLRNSHITLRVRTTNDVKSELTVKIKGSNGDQEINDDINPKEKDLLLNKGIFPNGAVKNYLLTLPYHLSSYKQISSLHNRRLEIQFDDHLLVIDKNNYNDITDYNLEIETKNSIELANIVLQEYIKKFHLSLHSQKYHGKAHRAIDSALKKD